MKEPGDNISDRQGGVLEITQSRKSASILVILILMLLLVGCKNNPTEQVKKEDKYVEEVNKKYEEEQARRQHQQLKLISLKYGISDDIFISDIVEFFKPYAWGLADELFFEETQINFDKITQISNANKVDKKLVCAVIMDYEMWRLAQNRNEIGKK